MPEFLFNGQVVDPLPQNWEILRELMREQAERMDMPDPIERFPDVEMKVLKKKESKMPILVAHYCGKNPPGLFGMEVEVEGVNLPPALPPYWNGHEDGSLRGESREYVFRQPLSYEDSITAIQHMNKAFAEKSELRMSFRTSVHVHVNVAEMDKAKLCTFLSLAFLLEGPLVNFSGKERVGNRFCLRVRDAEAKVDELARLFKGDPFEISEQGQVKYSAINLYPIRTFGSVEFRSMRGTTEENVLIPWLQVLKRIKDRSKDFKTPKEVFDFFDGRSVEAAKDILGDLYNTFKYKELENDIEISFSKLIHLPYEYTEEKQALKGEF